MKFEDVTVGGVYGLKGVSGRVKVIDKAVAAGAGDDKLEAVIVELLDRVPDFVAWEVGQSKAVPPEWLREIGSAGTVEHAARRLVSEIIAFDIDDYDSFTGDPPRGLAELEFDPTLKLTVTFDKADSKITLLLDREPIPDGMSALFWKPADEKRNLMRLVERLMDELKYFTDWGYDSSVRFPFKEVTLSDKVRLVMSSNDYSSAVTVTVVHAATVQKLSPTSDSRWLVRTLATPHLYWHSRRRRWVEKRDASFYRSKDQATQVVETMSDAGVEEVPYEDYCKLKDPVERGEEIGGEG